MPTSTGSRPPWDPPWRRVRGCRARRPRPSRQDGLDGPHDRPRSPSRGVGAMGPDKVEKLCQRAQLAIAQRDWATARQSYMMALALRSDLPDIHYGLATVYFQQSELTSAAHHFREVTRLDPLRAGAYINLGAVLNVLQQHDEAVEALRRGIKIDPQRTEGFYNLGLVY